MEVTAGSPDGPKRTVVDRRRSGLFYQLREYARGRDTGIISTLRGLNEQDGVLSGEA